MVMPIQRTCNTCGKGFETGDAIDDDEMCPYCGTPIFPFAHSMPPMKDHGADAWVLPPRTYHVPLLSLGCAPFDVDTPDDIIENARVRTMNYFAGARARA